MVMIMGLSLFTAINLGAQTKFDFRGLIKLFFSFYASDNQKGPYFFHESGDFACKRLESRFSLTANVSENVSTFIRIDAFASPDSLYSKTIFPEASQVGGFADVEPFELSVYEAYLKISRFLFRKLDLTVGKQRISWGSADKLNVIDNLNPLDFANFLIFDPDYFLERRPQVAFNFEYYLGRMGKFQLVWLLSRQYSPLPHGFTKMLEAGFPQLQGAEFIVQREKKALKNTNFGLRFATVVSKVDVSLSYYRGNFHLPYVYYIKSGFPHEIDATQVYFRFPEKEVFGLDLGGELASLGCWAELAYVQPEKVKAGYEGPFLLNGEPFLVNLQFPLFSNSYWQVVLGGDYTFNLGSGLYLNLQYLHGLFDEACFSSRSKSIFGLKNGMFFGELGDYLSQRVEFLTMNGDLEVGLSALIELSSEKSSSIFLPSLEYKLHDALVFLAGAILASGERERTKFGSFRNDRMVYLTTKVNF